MSFTNSSKITKQRLEQEKRYSTSSRRLRQATTESRTLEEIREEGEEILPIKDSRDDKIEEVIAPLNATPKLKLPCRGKYLNKYNTPKNRLRAINNLIEQKVELKLRDLITFNRGFVKTLRKRLLLVPDRGGNDVQIEDLTYMITIL